MTVANVLKLDEFRDRRLIRQGRSRAFVARDPMRARLFETASDYLANGTFDPLYVRGYGVPDAALAALTGTGVSDIPQTIGVNLLEQNAPNPFRPTTTIAYTVPRNDFVRLDVFDVTGRLVRELVGRAQPAGHHRVIWDGRDTAGRRVGSGVYFYRLATGDATETRRMVRMR